MIELEDFRELGLSDGTLKALKRKGFETPTPIQRLTIPVLLENTHDIIGQAQTGTGKTAAFGLPILEKAEADGKTQALILVPTRELALQVSEEMGSFKQSKVGITAIYGGAAITEQLRRLDKGVEIVVGTPGRILDHLRRGTLKIEALRWLILDEADEMLNMGFIEDIDLILSYANPDCRKLLFSATMPSKISQLAKKYMKDIEIIKVESQHMTTDLTDQIYFEVRESDKFDALTRIIDVEGDFYGIIFCRTKVGCDDLGLRLAERGYAAEALHGDVSQASREKILKKFKKQSINILVATDVAARGIDVSNLTHVINYSLPQDSESYVHRIGRTGRAGQQGTAITFISSSEYRQFLSMRRQVNADIRKEELPTAQDIVQMKKNKIMEDIMEIVANESNVDYLEMAEELLGNYSAEVALSSLLKLAFKNELDESNYPEIRRIDVDRRGTARLFIAMGKNEGYTPKTVVDLLKKVCGIPDVKINNVMVMETGSFATIPYADAEGAIRKLNCLSSDDSTVAEIAKEDKNAPSNDSFGGDRGGFGDGGRGRGRRPSGGGGNGSPRKSGGSGFGGNGGGGDFKRPNKRNSSDRPSRPSSGGGFKGPRGGKPAGRKKR